MSTTPEFLFFDLGNVLFHFSHARVCQQVSEVSGVPAGDVGAFIEQSDYMVQLETGATTIADIHATFCKSFGVSPPLDAIELAASDIFEVNAPIIPLLMSLVRARRRIGVLSNTSHAHWEFLSSRYTFLRKFFPVLSLSFELGVMKPDREIYERSAEMVGVPPERIFFTDDRAENIEGALAANWQAALFTNPNRLAEDLRSRGVKF